MNDRARQSILEREKELFIGIIKWIFYASCIGIIIGISSGAFIRALEWSISFVGDHAYYFFLLPIALFLSELIVKHLAPEARGHGTEKVIEAVHLRYGKMNFMVVPVKAIATIITIAFGGSAGKEGPCAQIGAGLSSLIADIFKMNDEDRRKLVICGISAGFSAVFGTPIAGSIFGIEVIYVGSILYEMMLASFIAGIVSFQTASLVGVKYAYHYTNIVLDFNQTLFLAAIVSGIAFGACSLLTIEVMGYSKKISQRINVSSPVKGLIGGAVLVALALAFSSQYLGLSIGLIERSLEGSPIDPYAFLAKIVFTSITLSFGGSGGVITPIFVIGSTAGAFFARVLGLSVPAFAAIGLVSVLAGTTKTPIASSIMAIELFGPYIGPYAAIACIISFIVSGPSTVYPSQVFSLKKFV
ncbi:chloride channel protein [Methanocella conradii]|uniref:chloride channel protein n=1 Tax=Methanocella conradii TaxID=1175444 RepID=UPI00157D7971|nr:chloride channel protein [Methanocella conradii]